MVGPTGKVTLPPAEIADIDEQTTPTDLVYLHDGLLRSLDTEIVSVTAFSALEPENQALFNNVDRPSQESYVIATRATIFHPQGGGQPSDIGNMMDSRGTIFNVISARMSALDTKQVLHYGHHITRGANPPLEPGNTITQSIDPEKRLLFSRYHTAGHVLGGAVRKLLGDSIPDFDELKASHVPGAAACEFQGLIDGSHKSSIQSAVDDIVASSIPVQIVWWALDDFRKHNLERLVPQGFNHPKEKLRVILMEGVEAYPCGGTHVGTTDQCEQTTVTKIKRQKGTSRVSYTVAA